jgi:DNA-binding IclR family transcriptional regulator
MDRSPVKSAVRALEVLSLFSHERKELSQAEIIKKLSYPQSSATFLLKSLMEAGYLSYDRRQRTYLPTPEVLHLGSWLQDFGYDYFFRKSVITDMLQELQQATDETVCVTTQNDIFAQFHRVMVRNLSVTMYIPEGTMLPLSYCAYGYMLLSCQSPAKADRICRLINAREREPSRRLVLSKIANQLAQTRERGYCYLRNPYLLGAGSIAMLLPVTVAGRPIAIGIGGVAERMELKLDKMQRTLKKIVSKYAGELTTAFCAKSHS